MNLFGLLPEEDFETLSDSTRELVQELGNVNFVVIGASGFLGRWLASFFTYLQLSGTFQGTLTLIARDESKIVEFQNMPQSQLRRVIQTDKLRSNSFSHLNPERVVVFFAASSTSSATLLREKSDEKAVLLAEQVISSMPEKHVTFIHLSSGGIYDPSARQLQAIPSNYKLQIASENAYIDEKIYLEAWSRKQNLLGRFTSRNPRLFSFYGPGLQLDRHFAIGEFMRQGIEGSPILVKGNPSNMRSYLYPTDAIWQLLLQGQLSEPVHQQLGSGRPIAIHEVAKLIAGVYGVPFHLSATHSQNTDNYVPLDVPTVSEKRFDLGIQTWARWLKSRKFE